jgi:periplasmic protein TonB
MKRRLFEDLVVSAPARGLGRRIALVPLSVAAHAVVVALALLVPVLAPGDLPPTVHAGPIIDYATIPTTPRPTPPSPVRVGEPSRRHDSMQDPAPAAAPAPGPLVSVVEPGNTPTDFDAPPRCFSDCDGPPGPATSTDDRGGTGVGPGTGEAPVRVSSGIKEPRRVVYVPPVYPDIARAARVEGIVIVDCTIDRDGRVIDARVLRGHPLLDEAALAAVRRWVYMPTLLNGVPVPVLMTVTVRFVLQR